MMTECSDCGYTDVRKPGAECALCDGTMEREYIVHGWIERNIGTRVRAVSPEAAAVIGEEELKDDLREKGIPVDWFSIDIDEVEPVE